jgi:hypothetical protein|tara:strand:+ start:739 stop:1278 length:540 start_codon:yes stop_codon:yes gene_type:complete
MIQTSNFGEAVYPFLSSPDTHFKTEGEYHVKLKVKKADAQEDIKKIQEVISKEVAEEHKKKPGNTQPLKRAPLPYKEEGDFVIFHFKMKASGINGKTKEPFTQKPKLVDHALNPIGDDKFIYGGSIMRVNYEPVGYNVASVGLGCTLRLKGAQITKLVEGTNATSGFDKVEPVVEHNNY